MEDVARIQANCFVGVAMAILLAGAPTIVAAGDFTYLTEMGNGLQLGEGFYGQLDLDPNVEALAWDPAGVSVFDLALGIEEYFIAVPNPSSVNYLIGFRDADHDGVAEFFLRDGVTDTIYAIEGTTILFSIPGTVASPDAVHQLDGDSSTEMILRDSTNPFLMRFVDMMTGSVDAQYDMPGNWTPALIMDLDGDLLNEVLIHCDCGGDQRPEYILVETTGQASEVGGYGSALTVPLLRLRTHENPSGGKVSLRLESSEPTNPTLSVFDSAGRRIRTLLDGLAPAEGTMDIVWDGLTDSGERVAAGVYFAQVQANGHLASTRLVVVR